MGFFRPCRGILEAPTGQSLCVSCGVVPLSGLEDTITAAGPILCLLSSSFCSLFHNVLSPGRIQGCIVDGPVGEILPTHIHFLHFDQVGIVLVTFVCGKAEASSVRMSHTLLRDFKIQLETIDLRKW